MLEITNHGEVREIRLARPPVNPVAAAITGHSPAGGAVICGKYSLLRLYWPGWILNPFTP